MTFKSFIIGMLISFGAAWMFVIAIPTAKMGSLAPVKMSTEEDAEYYQRKLAGRMRNGSEIYSANGCYACHTQLIRPTTFGRQIWREDIAGVILEDGTDTRRETSPYDYTGEDYAQIGLTRTGPDLSNFGYRAEKYAAAANMSAEQWVLQHLDNPRNSSIRIGPGGEKLNMDWSNCPSQPQMFTEVKIQGQSSELAIHVDHAKGTQVVPKEQARVLANYLLSLKRDDAMPESMNYAPKKLAESK
ncbi:MAG: cbb3-type cytochrome c oxidase subunit II [Akkermansiaceae bacterium]